MRQRKQYEIKATTYDKRGRVIAVAYNTYSKTHPYQAELSARVALTHDHINGKYSNETQGYSFKQFLHAEIAAIIKSRKHDIYSIKIERYDSHGNPKMAAPCPICQLAIKEAGIKEVTYTVG